MTSGDAAAPRAPLLPSHTASYSFLHTSTKPFLVESPKKTTQLAKQFIFCFVFTLPTKLKPQSTPLKSTPLNT